MAFIQYCVSRETRSSFVTVLFSPSFYVPGLWFVNPRLDFQIGLVLPFKLSGKLASLRVKFIQKPLFV
jgi:hypothetical protein